MSNNELDLRDNKSLTEKLNLPASSIIGKDIVVSDLGIVTDENKQELPINDFIKRIKANVKSDQGQIKYDKDSNSFYLIKKDDNNKNTIYKISINEEEMKKYVKGDYDKATYELHNLYLVSEEKNKLARKAESKEKETNTIIAKADTNLSKLSPIEAREYLDYLQKEDRSHTATIAKKSATLAAVTGVPIASGLIAGAICFAPGAAFGITILAGLMGTTIGSLAEGMVTMFATDEPGFDILPIKTSKRLIRDIKDKFRKLRVNRTKEKELKKIKYVDKIVMPKSVTIEEKEPIEALDLTDNIMSEINDMVDRAAYVNGEERNVLLADLKSLLNEYLERKTAIINQEKGTRSQTDNLVSLRNDICKKLAKIELRLNDAKARNAKTSAVLNEGNLLADKIEKVEQLDPKDLQERQEEIDKMFEEEITEEESITKSAK